MSIVTRTTNPNGTYRYEIDGELQYKASKVLYTHVSTYTNDAVLFHKTEAAARKTTGYKHWTKAGYQAIVDGDAAPEAPQTPVQAQVPAQPETERIYAVVAVSPTTGEPLPGAPTRKYRATSGRDAGQRYAAASGLTDPRPAAHYAGDATAEFFTFLPGGSEGSRMRVHAVEVEPSTEVFGGLTVHPDAYIFGLCLRYANRNGLDYWALTMDEKFALEDAARADAAK